MKLWVKIPTRAEALFPDFSGAAASFQADDHLFLRREHVMTKLVQETVLRYFHQIVEFYSEPAQSLAHAGNLGVRAVFKQYRINRPRERAEFGIAFLENVTRG